MSGPASLVERSRETAALAAHVARARNGQGALVVVEGPAGIGKSRLLAQARDEAAAAGLTVLAARGSDLEREFPFGVVRQLFEGALADPERRAAALAGPAAGAEGLFGAPADGGVGDASFAALHGLYWLTLNLAAAGPIALAVDDLHWVDAPSLRFLAYLARRLEGAPVLVLAGLRTGEPGVDPLQLGDLAGPSAADVIRPGPLSEAAAAELLEARLRGPVSPAFAQAFHAATGGNPLLVDSVAAALELEHVTPDETGVDALRHVGSRAVASSVAVRLARLPAAAVQVARAVAILGESDEPATVTRLAEVEPAALGGSVAALSRAGILASATPLRFAHPLVRDAVLLDLAPLERETRHARAAKLLAEAGASDERIAGQLLSSLPAGDPWVVERLTAAAGVAVRRGAPEGAIPFLRRALAEPPPEPFRPAILRGLGTAEAGAGSPEALEHLHAALAVQPDPDERARIARIVCHAETFSGDPARGWATAREAAAALPPESPLAAEVEAFALAAEWSLEVDPGKLARAEELLARHPDSLPVQALVASLECHHGRDRERAVRLAQGALAGGHLFALDLGGFLSIPAWTVLLYADHPDAMATIDAALERARRGGSWFLVNSLAAFRGFGLRLSGELEDAERALREGRVAMRRLHPRIAVYGAGLLGHLLADRGAVAEALAVLEESPAGDEHGHAGMYWRRARLAATEEAHDPQALLAAAQDAHERQPGTRNPAVLPWRSARARALHGLGRGEEALADAAEELAMAREWGAAGPLARALRVEGELRDSLAALEAAAEVAEGTTWRLEQARALLALGAARRRRGDQTGAREPLRRALELADRSGARGLVERARTELAAAGARPRTTALSGPEALTSSERRVADMAAAGRTNREIAQELFVTPKTVEVHLSATYRKLGIGSRRELGGALAA